MALPPVGNERPDFCGPCGGLCCKNGPGLLDPKDLGADLPAAVKRLLASGDYKPPIARWFTQRVKALTTKPARPANAATVSP